MCVCVLLIHLIESYVFKCQQHTLCYCALVYAVYVLLFYCVYAGIGIYAFDEKFPVLQANKWPKLTPVVVLLKPLIFLFTTYTSQYLSQLHFYRLQSIEKWFEKKNWKNAMKMSLLRLP